MALGRYKRAVGVFPTRREAEQALHELRDSGFSMDKVSVVARDADKNDGIAGAEVSDRVGNKADEGATAGAIAGGTLGGLTGLLVGLGALAIPGIGPVMLAGAAATTIATTLSGTAIGAAAGSLLGALIGLGIPEERARVYNERVSRGEYLVIIDGTEDEVRRAETIMNRRGIQEFGIYDAPDEGRVRTDAVTTPTPVTPIATGTGIRRDKYAVGYFPHYRDAEQAIAELRAAGFPLSQVSLVAQNFERRESFTGANLSDRFDGMRFGFPDERARFYNDRVSRGEYVVIVNGTDDEVHHAASILSDRGIQEWQIYDPTEINSNSNVVNRNDIPGVTAAPVGYAATATTPRREAVGTPMGRHRRAIGVFPYRRDAEAALAELRESGFVMDNVSVVAKDADHDDQLAGADLSNRVAPQDATKVDEGAKAGAATGGALGGLGGLLVGLGTLAIPGVGPVIAGGAVATALTTALAGGAIGAAAGGLTGALVGLGIPDDQAKIYNDRVARGYYLVLVDGTETEITRAEAILNGRGVQDLNIYDAPGVEDSRASYGSVDSVTPIDTNNPVTRNVNRSEANVTIIDNRDRTP